MTENPLTPFSQRQRLMGLACALALKCGLRAGRYQDPEATDPRFAGVLHIDLPTGQLTIHTDEQDREDYAWHALPLIERTWDGHTQAQAFYAVSKFVSHIGAAFDRRTTEERIGARLFSVYLAEAAELNLKAEQLEAATTTDEGRRIVAEVCEDLRGRAKQLESGLIAPVDQEFLARAVEDARASNAELEEAQIELARLRDELAKAVNRVSAVEHGALLHLKASDAECARLRDELADALSLGVLAEQKIEQATQAQRRIAAEVQRRLHAEALAFPDRLDVLGALQRVGAPVTGSL